MDNSSVDVNLLTEPSEYGAYSIWIGAIDYGNNKLYLTNGQGEKGAWIVTKEDFPILKGWRVNNHLLVLKNEEWKWWLSGYKYILINTRSKQEVHAKKVD